MCFSFFIIIIIYTHSHSRCIDVLCAWVCACKWNNKHWTTDLDSYSTYIYIWIYIYNQFDPPTNSCVFECDEIEWVNGLDKDRIIWKWIELDREIRNKSYWMRAISYRPTIHVHCLLFGCELKRARFQWTHFIPNNNNTQHLYRDRELWPYMSRIYCVVSQRKNQCSPNMLLNSTMCMAVQRTICRFSSIYQQ